MAPALVSALAFCLASLLWVTDAHAHAVLLETSPGDGAVLLTAPTQVVLRFNETVTPMRMHVVDRMGRTLAAGEAVTSVNTVVRIALPPALSTGGYLVTWRVVSADGHPVGGTFAFSIGTAHPGMPPASAGNGAWRETSWHTSKIALRFLQDVSLLVTAGGALFLLLVLRGQRAAVPRLVPAICVSGGLAMAAAVLQVGVQGGWLAAAPLAAFLQLTAWRLGAASTVGISAAAMIGGLLILALGLAMRRGEIAMALVLLGALSAPTSLALTGHAVTAGWPAQAVLALHSITVAFWLGAFWPLLVIVRTCPSTEAAAIVHRFSRLAMLLVAVLCATGVGTALTRISDRAGLLASDYGRMLLFKVLFVAALLAVAAINRYRLLPAMSSGVADAARDLQRNIRIELVLGVAVLLITAVLAHTPPPPDVARYDHAHHTAASVGYTMVTMARGRTLVLAVSPAGRGSNTLSLWLTDRNGAPLESLEVTVELALPEAGIEPFVRRPEAIEPGRYRLEGLDLPLSGRWTARVDALVTDFEKAVFRAEVPIR